MEMTDAIALADRITAIEGRQILTRDEWVSELLPLDRGTAGTALVRCMKAHAGPIALHEYLSTYDGLQTRHTNPIPNFDCRNCDDGMRTAYVIANGMPYAKAYACGCRPAIKLPRLPNLGTPGVYRTEHDAWDDPDVRHDLWKRPYATPTHQETA